ncbi:MAG TPA: cytochrome B5 [Clostridiales bacterium]|nr:cytochrome B5 [Clostridiales bacterium]
MNDREIFINMINDNLNEMNGTIDCLYITTSICAKNKLLNRLRRNMSNINLMLQGLRNGESMSSPPSIAERLFTMQDLSRYNGRDGNPAYIAVNGVVYDVTSNAAWGGATHFGLSAGTDVTSQFASCHAGQPILSKLKVVGKLVE